MVSYVTLNYSQKFEGIGIVLDHRTIKKHSEECFLLYVSSNDLLFFAQSQRLSRLPGRNGQNNRVLYSLHCYT